MCAGGFALLPERLVGSLLMGLSAATCQGRVPRVILNTPLRRIRLC
jgi:hypothetical protein